MKLIFQSLSPSDIDEIANEILTQFKGIKIFLLHGEMGSGKTTLIKSFCKILGCLDPVSSPTYGIVHEYHTSENTCIYHFDLFRIKELSELIDIGMDDYLLSGNYCFVEWPKLIIPSLEAEKHLHIHITEMDGSRDISVGNFPEN